MRKFVMLFAIAVLAVVMTGCACCGICGAGKKSCGAKSACATKGACATKTAVDKTK